MSAPRRHPMRAPQAIRQDKAGSGHRTVFGIFRPGAEDALYRTPHVLGKKSEPGMAGKSMPGSLGLHGARAQATKRGSSGLPCADALLDALADVLVDVLPVLEGALLHRLGHAAQEVAGDGGYQPVTRGGVEDPAQQEAPHVSPRVRTALLARHRRESDPRPGTRPRLGNCRPRVLACVVRHLEVAERA